MLALDRGEVFPSEARLAAIDVEVPNNCSHLDRPPRNITPLAQDNTPDKMAPNNLPASFNATSQDIELLLAAQSHLGSKNLQVHMEPYLWKTRPDGINVINVGKTWYGA